MSNKDEVEIKFGYENFSNYRRLSYKWWYAIAEFVDNSTQSYFDNQEELNGILEKEDERFKVIIATDKDFIRITDNAMGMDRDDISRALVVGKPPENTSDESRSKYGLGLKTATCWIGNNWTLVTSKLGSNERLTIDIDVDDVSSGKVKREIRSEPEEENKHYTRLEIMKHNRPLAGRTIGKIKEYLKSIYRKDICSNQVILTYNDEILEWTNFEDNDFLSRKDGSRYKKDFIFEIDTDQGKKVAEGWVGVLETGSRKKAGFSIFHRKRLIKGYPDSWRPEEIFGSGGRNDLINQRLVGEINLENFEVSHTKDEINWRGDEEELVEKELRKECKEYMEAARKHRRGEYLEGGPQQIHIDSAMRDIEEELVSPEFVEQLTLSKAIPSIEQIKQAKDSVIGNVSSEEANITAKVGGITVKLYLGETLSPNDPYYTNEGKNDGEVIVVVNTRHPHWKMLDGENAILNFLRHCIYDAIAEDCAERKDRLESDTIKLLKDHYLRVSFQILQSKSDA